MAAARRGVFVEKVLKRLFPHDPRDREKKTPVPAASETLPTLPEKARCGRAPPLPGGSTETPLGRRLYTVTPPPEGCAPAPPEPLRHASSQSSSSSDDAGDQDPRGQPKRRRVRRHRSQRRCGDPGGARVEHATTERWQSFSQEEAHPRHTDGPTISRNKKRKLKKKQQMKRRRAAGSLPRASGISFLYEPGEEGPEQGDSSEGAGGGCPGTEDHEDAGDTGDREEAGDAEDARDTGEDRGRGSDEKADGILDFFKSTQEMYFYDGVSKDSDPAFLAAAEQLLDRLGARSLPASDLLALDHMRTLLFLQDPGQLQRALQVFTEHCTVPPDQARVISAFFHYWVTHVLPRSSE